jgi:hypothetical protein
MIGYKDVRFSFLTAGPAYTLQIGDGFDDLPELSSPLWNGRGPRSFDYAPAQRDPGILASENRLVEVFQRPSGGTAELHERFEPPQLWWLRWPLETGALYTHLREEDGLEMAAKTVAQLDIAGTGPGSPPFLIPNPPLRFAASSAPEFQEVALYFWSRRGPQWGVQLQRPGFTPAGTVLVAPIDDPTAPVSMRAGTTLDVDVRVWGEDSTTVEELLGHASESLRPE